MEAFFSLANLGAMEADPAMNLFATASRSVIIHRLMLWCLVNPLVLFVFGGAVMESFVKFEDKDREVKDIDVACKNRVDMIKLASDLQGIVGAIPGMQSTYELIEPDDNDRRTWWKNRHVKLAFTHKAVTVELDICDAEHVRKRPDTDTGKLSNLVQNFGCERCWRRVRGLRWGGGPAHHECLKPSLVFFSPSRNKRARPRSPPPTGAPRRGTRDCWPSSPRSFVPR